MSTGVEVLVAADSQTLLKWLLPDQSCITQCPTCTNANLQILEQTVYPILSSLATAGSTQASQVLNPLRSPESSAEWQGQPPLSVDAAHRALLWMPAMQEWAILSLLVCPSKVLKLQFT